MCLITATSYASRTCWSATGRGAFSAPSARAALWWEFRHFYLTNLGLSSTKTPPRHRITLSIKNGRRGIYNNEEIADHLRAVLPEVELDVRELYSLGGWQNELAYLQETSVLITPCGGVSMSSMFLPQHSSLIVVDYWSVGENRSVGMEEQLWTNLGYIRSFHYPFVESDVRLDVPGRSRQVHDDMRNFGSVVVRRRAHGGHSESGSAARRHFHDHGQTVAPHTTDEHARGADT